MKVQQWMPLQRSWATLTYHTDILAASARRATPSYFVCAHLYATTAIYSLYGAMPINPLLLQDFNIATLAVCQGILFCKTHATDL